LKKLKKNENLSYGLVSYARDGIFPQLGQFHVDDCDMCRLYYYLYYFCTNIKSGSVFGKNNSNEIERKTSVTPGGKLSPGSPFLAGSPLLHSSVWHGDAFSKLRNIRIDNALLTDILENTQTPTSLLTSSSSLLLPYSSSSFLPSFHTLSTASASLLRSGLINYNYEKDFFFFLNIGMVEVGMLAPPIYHGVFVSFLLHMAFSINKLPSLVACGFLTYLPRFCIK
jgi:hypothetical protein